MLGPTCRRAVESTVTRLPADSLDLDSGWQCVVTSAVASALPWVLPAALAGHLTPLSGSFVRPRGTIGGR
jgi:hypothetical protein